MSTLNTLPGLLRIQMRTEEPFINMCLSPGIDLDHYFYFKSWGFKSMILTNTGLLLERMHILKNWKLFSNFRIDMTGFEPPI